MTSVEKRRSGRKSGGHRKHSDGGYSDTSSGGSFLDETDREVSNLTDRAFRSLCIGDEAVYNDSDLCSSSPCSQRDRQLAFSQGAQDRDREDREREELKRTAHESFSLRVQQYGQDWIHEGVYGPQVHRDPQWEVYGERTQGRVSATFQHSFVETSQQEESLRDEQLPFLSNGATELSSQQRRSRSRVSSLIRAFNSDGYRDGAGMDGKLREWNDETSWDKSALMSIQRELSEFSTSYQQNFNSGHFPSAGPFSSRDTNFYSSQVGAVAHMNSESSFMRSSHSKHSMSAQVSCNSNFFIHSEFSPFKVWRDYNRFPFQQGEVSGFMHCSEFPKWYETPMYKELSLEAQPQGSYRFEERAIRHPRNNLAPVVPTTPSRSTSTSTMLQKALPVEKRCESELAGHYPHRKRTQSLGANRLPSQRPSTASPTIEMSRRVQDTISSVKALQQKIKMMTEENITSGITAYQQGVHCCYDNSIPFGNNAKTVAPNVVSSNTSTTPFSISQLLTPSVHTHQEAETSDVRQYAVSPQPVEHPPVRAESRGATPDVRMSSYKSRATSLLFNLKDNRKRVKTTYSPPKFKGLETLEKNKQPPVQEPRDTVIDIPDFLDTDTQFPHTEQTSRTNAASQQYINQYHSPGVSLTTLGPQPATAHTGQYLQYTSSDYQPVQVQGEMVHHAGLTGFIPENYTTNQLANGQNLHEDLSSFTAYRQGMIDNVEILGGDVYRLKPSNTATEAQRLNVDNNQTGEYLISKANTEQHFNETLGREFTKVDRYPQLKDSKHDYSNVSSQDRWRQTSSQDTESLKTDISPWKQEITTLMERGQHTQAYERAATIKEELNLPGDKYRDNQQSINNEIERIHFRESFGVGTSSHKKAGLVNPDISNQQPQYAPFSNDTVENPAYYGQQQHGAFKDKYALQMYYGQNKENEMKDNNLTQNHIRYTDQDYRNQQTLYSNRDKTMVSQETGQRKPTAKGHEMQSLHPLFEHSMQKNSLSNPDSPSALIMANRVEHRQFVEVKAEQAMSEHIKAQHTQAELAKAQHWAQVEQPKVESARLNLARPTGSEKVKAELTQYERVNQSKTEHVKDKKRKEEHEEQCRVMLSDQAREEQAKAAQTRVQKVTEEPNNMTEGTGAKHMRVEQGEQVKAEAERLKEEHIKTELAKTKQAGQEKIKQASTQQARGESVKAEQPEEEQVKEVERERVEAEQIRPEEVKIEQAAAEHGKAEQVQLEQMKEQLAKAEQKKTKISEDDSIQAGQKNGEQPITQMSKAKEEKVAHRKAEQTKKEQSKVERTKTENMQERSAKLVAKVTATHQIKNEPDKVEQVKTELAKAKAELAKIKEKMRGEQKEKVRNTTSTKEDGIKKDAPLIVNINKSEEHRDKDQATQAHQPREDSAFVSRHSTDQANRGADEYSRLREKYGLTGTASTNKNRLSAAGNVSLNEKSETPALTPDKPKNNEKSRDKHNPPDRCATDNTENKVEVGSFEPNEVTERHYVYSESSKEFKLSSSDYLPTSVDRENRDTATDKVKDGSVEKLEKCDPLKPADVPQQRNSDSAKPTPLERKPKSAEHSVGPGNDPHFTPIRALSSKERAQTKQEILTSKIKAHAEKEISAIKERGFAIRDGFISKTSTKQIAGSQSMNVRQRPPSQDVSKKPESIMSSNSAPKQQMEPPGIQMAPVKSVSPPSSAIIPVKSAATTSQLVDQSQKQVPKEPMKNSDNVPHVEAKQAGSYTMNTDDSLMENQRKESQSGIKSTMQSEEQEPKSRQGKQEANGGETSGKQKERLNDNPAVNTDQLNKKEDDPAQTTALAEVENSELITTEKAVSKNEAAPSRLQDSAPSLNPVFGQNETPVADDNLQIVGIMVTVREKKSTVNIGQSGNSTQGQMNAKEEAGYSAPDKSQPTTDLRVTKENVSSKEDSKVKDAVVQSTPPQTKGGVNNDSENLQETSNRETRSEQNNAPENVTGEKTNPQRVGSSTNTRTQREIQLHEPLTEKGVPSTVTVPAKNKASAATQSLLYTRDMMARETKDSTNTTAKDDSAKSIRTEEKSNTEEKNLPKVPHADENVMAEMVKTGIKTTNDSSRVNDETLIKHESRSSMKADMTTVINASKSRSIDGKISPLLEEKRHDSTPPKPFNKSSASNHLTEDENIHISPKHECNEMNTGGNNEMDEVHIGSIAIRVVPAVTEKDNLKMVGQHHVTAVPPYVVVAEEHKQVVSPSHKEKVNTSDNEDRTKECTPANGEKQVKDTTSENTQTQNGESEKADQSGKSVNEAKIQRVEGDYFQVQGVVETNDEPHNRENVGDTLRLTSDKVAVSNESDNEGKNESFVLDQKIKLDPSSERVQDENMRKKNKETEDNLASKQSDDPTERQSNKNDKTEAGQAIHIRKPNTENQFSLSAGERQSSRNGYQTRENMVKEKPEVKPKPKERSSTIPEISAIADYARLKVIVSEERENTVQEFPPNKREGFFPLIQSRHSRRPVFTADPQDLSVKERNLPNKTEVTSKVNKEAKPLVFPITEKEHQRTGMFKLGDKERQEKTLVDAKANERVSDAGGKHLKERNKSPANDLKKQGSGTQVAASDTQRAHQVDQTIHPPVQAITSSSANNKPRISSVSQHLKPSDNSHPHEKPIQSASKAERSQYLDKNSLPQPTLGKVYNTEENKHTIRKDEKIRNTPAKLEEERARKQRQEGLATQHGETTAKQSRAKQIEEEQACEMEMDKRAEDMKIKHMIKESRASLAEEERRAAQREEERRAREREAIAVQIKERREKQREAERKAEEERKAKQTEEESAAQKDAEMRARQREEMRTRKENEEKRRIKVEEERKAKLREEEERIKENEEMRRVKQREEERAAQDAQQRRALQEEQQRRAAQQEQQRRAAHDEQQRRAAQQEQQNRAALLEEQQKKAAHEEQQRRAAQQEQQNRAALLEEQQKKAAHEEQQRRAAHEEQQKKAAHEEQQRRAALLEEQQKKAAQQEQQRKAAHEEQQRRAALLEEQQRRAALLEEQQKKAAQQEQQRRAAHEEQQSRAALIEVQQKKAAQQEQQRRAAHEEQQSRAALIEVQQKKAAQQEQQRRAAHEEQQSRTALIEEQQKKAAQQEQQRRAAHEEQQRRAALLEEQQRKAALLEEQQKKAAQQEQQRKAALLEEQQKKAARGDQERRAAYEEQQRRAALLEVQQKKAAQKEHERRASLLEVQQRRTAQEEQERRATQEEQQRRAAQEEQQRRAGQKAHQRRADLIEEQWQAKEIKEKVLLDNEEENKIKQRAEEKEAQISEEERIKQTEQKKSEYEIEEQRGERQNRGEWMTNQNNQASLKEEETTVAQEEILAQREDEMRDKKREEEKLAAYRERERAAQIEEQKRAAQRMDALQYYAITSTQTERKPRERQLSPPLPSQPRNNPPVLESTDDSHTSSYRPHAPASPAPSLPRSNTSSPALGIKPSMFRVKDNTTRGSSFTRSVKPRFHKNFGDDFQVGSPMGSERGEEELETMRRNAVTPVPHDKGFNRLAAIKESSTFQPATSSQDYSANSAPHPHYRPYSRRSFALDEDDSRSVISNMSEDVESFATSAADLADVRGLYDYDRPESACSFSSDVSRSLGKPPAVPPKSEKALRRAKRLTTRRIKKELSKVVADSPAEKPAQEASGIPSSSTEVRSSSRHAVASPHFSPPVSLAHVPRLEPSLPSSHTERQSSHSSFYASPHATGPISLPAASPHATAPVSLPVASPHATVPASHTATPKTVVDVPSSPTLHHANPPAPVTQYHVESSYPQSYPLTQRKVLQDLGSGQYFVVDVPVQVKMKTFFDPETGKYVQLNVRESTKSTSRPLPQQTYLQPQLQPQSHVKPQQKPLSRDSPAGKNNVHYQGYHGYPKSYQPTAMNSVPHGRSSVPVTVHQDQEPVRESHSYGYPANEMRQNDGGHHYSPEKAPYMDTVNDTDKTYNTVYNTHGTYESFPEGDTNSQLAGSSVCENDSSAHSQYQPRDIITISELEDFMELSDW